MTDTWKDDNCAAMKAHYSVYSVPEAAALWCGVPGEIIEQVLIEVTQLSETGFGRGVWKHPDAPCIEPRSRAIAEAIESGKLSHGREDGKIVDDISVNIREDGGSAYTTSTDFKTLLGKDIIFSFRRAGGLKAKFSNNALHTEPFRQNYYHFILNIYNVSNDVFKAEIKLHSNTIRHLNKKLEGITNENLIIKYEIEGMLFTKNEYLLSDKGSPDINVILEFDKICSAEEIKERLQQKNITKT